MGTEMVELEFIFDTGSPWLWTPTTECEACHASRKYDVDKS